MTVCVRLNAIRLATCGVAARIDCGIFAGPYHYLRLSVDGVAVIAHLANPPPTGPDVMIDQVPEAGWLLDPAD